jgi:spore germination protein YaaH
VPVRPSEVAARNADSPYLGRREAPKTLSLRPARVQPVAANTAVASAPPLAPHEVFGFVPYWTLGQSAGFDIAGLTTLDYFSVNVNRDGTLDESGPDWNGYESQALSTLITRAHGAGMRVVLTVADFDQHSLDQLTSSATASATLSETLIGAIEAKNLDGVNLDLEGMGPADQAGLTRLVTTVADALHQVNPHWQVTMDTYASSAGDPDGFYDIVALARVVDAFFVMAYSPNVAATAQASSPLTSSLFNDLTTVEQYVATVPPDKVILGVPFYGEDWPTSGNTLSATASGSATTLTDSEIEGTGNPIYWDSVTDSAWTAYQIGNQWHETFFDDPTSLYQIEQLASGYALRGVGVWALGMDGTSVAMVDALEGVAPAIHYATPSTSTTTTTVPSAPTTTTTTTGATTPTSAPSSAPAPTTPGGVPGGAADPSVVGGNGTGPTTSGSIPSITGTFEAESLATVGNAGATSSSVPPPQNVTLCLVTTALTQSGGCEAPPPLTATDSSTGDPSDPAPPFPGATVAGVLQGVIVNNDSPLKCLEDENQTSDSGSLSTVTQPELVVWQAPGTDQYFYVVATSVSPTATAVGCGAATLAFANPTWIPPAGVVAANT